jgi:hypothetical protein
MRVTRDEGCTSETGNGVTRDEGCTSETGNGVTRDEGLTSEMGNGEKLMWKAIIAIVLLPFSLAAQEACPTGWFWNSIGVDGFHCSGGKCEYEMNRTGPGIGFAFSAEPRLRAVDPAGASGGKLQEGDVLVAVNERLIVTLPGGAELGRLPADRDANITVRRGDRLIAVNVRPKQSCRPPTLLVGETIIEDASSRRTLLDGSLDLAGLARLQGSRDTRTLGISIRCAECGFSVQRGTPPQISLTLGRDYPVVTAMERGGMAERAGMRVGDEIRRISGLDVLTQNGTALLTSPPRGEFEISVMRAGREQLLRSGPLSSIRIVDGVQVERAIDQSAHEELRIVRQGDHLRSDEVLGTVVRWWRSLARDAFAPAMLVTRGNAWGDGDLGFLVGSDRIQWRINAGSGEQSWSLERPLRVVEVIPNSLAERAGLRKDDVITHANELDVHTEAGARALLLTPRRNAVVLKVQRDGREMTITIPPRAM